MSKETWVFLPPEALAFKITLGLLHLGARYYGLRASAIGGCIMLARNLKARIWREILSGKKRPFVLPDSGHFQLPL